MVRLAGIDVRLHVSMLLLVWLVGAYAAEDPRGVAGAAAWVATIFVCVLVHELAHSLTARRFGIAVKEIELLPIGGVSKLERIPNDPRQEVAIALAGPLTSIAIGAVFLAGAAVVSGQLPAVDLAGGPMPSRVGWFNLVIGGFNLLPALPLDGGRVLRALFEQREGPVRATHHAARVARRLAWVLIGVGAFANFFLMIIGLFVHVVSRAEEVDADVRHALEGLRVEDLMVRRPVVVSADSTLREVRNLLGYTSQRQFPVVDDSRCCGVLDVRRVAGVDGDTVASRVCVEVPSLRPETPIPHVDLTQAASPVLDDGGHVVGLLRAEDVALAAQSALAVPAAG